MAGWLSKAAFWLFLAALISHTLAKVQVCQHHLVNPNFDGSPFIWQFSGNGAGGPVTPAQAGTQAAQIKTYAAGGSPPSIARMYGKAELCGSHTFHFRFWYTVPQGLTAPLKLQARYNGLAIYTTTLFPGPYQYVQTPFVTFTSIGPSGSVATALIDFRVFNYDPSNSQSVFVDTIDLLP